MNFLDDLPIEEKEKMLFDVLREKSAKVEEHVLYDGSEDEDRTYLSFCYKDLVDREVGNKGYRLTITEKIIFHNSVEIEASYYSQRFVFRVNGHEITLKNFWDFMFMETGRPDIWHPQQIRDFLFKNVDIV